MDAGKLRETDRGNSVVLGDGAVNVALNHVSLNHVALNQLL